MPLAPQHWMASAPPAVNVGLNLSVNGYDRTSYLADGSLTCRVGVHGNSLGTADATFNDPPVVPQAEDIVRVFADTRQLFEGRVKNVEHTEFKGGHRFVKIGAQDNGPNTTLPTVAPWGLSDTPDGTTTHGYESMQKIIRTTEGGTVKTTLQVTLAESGLWANMLVALTSVVHGLAASSYQVNDASLSWRNTKTPPQYTLECGSPIVSLAQLVSSGTMIDPGTITATQISDGAVTTPKLNAGAIISKVANIAGTVAIDENGVRITGGALSVINPGGTVIIDGSSDMFRIAATGTMSLATINGDRNIQTTVSLPSLGALAVTPAQLNQVGNSVAANGLRWIGTSYGLGVTGNMYVATTSGGVANNLVINLNRWEAQSYGDLDASSFARIILECSNQSGANKTVYTRYYVLQQVAI